MYFVRFFFKGVQVYWSVMVFCLFIGRVFRCFFFFFRYSCMLCRTDSWVSVRTFRMNGVILFFDEKNSFIARFPLS